MAQLNQVERAKIINKKQLCEITGLSATTWWRLTRAGLAPGRVKLSAGRVGWRMGDVFDWLSSRTEV